MMSRVSLRGHLRVVVERLQLAAHAHHRRRADGEVKVRGVQLDHSRRTAAKSMSISAIVSPLIGSHRGTRNSGNFLDRGEPHADLVDAVLLERAHALLDRDRRDAVGGRALDRQLADLLRDRHRLVEADAALVAGEAAALAALGLVGLDVARRRRSCASASARSSTRLLAAASRAAGRGAGRRRSRARRRSGRARCPSR